MKNKRSIEGTDREVDGDSDDLGAVDTVLMRMSKKMSYVDGVGEMMDGPNPRTVTNAVCQQAEDMPNERRLSDMVWAWGQFLVS